MATMNDTRVSAASAGVSIPITNVKGAGISGSPFGSIVIEEHELKDADDNQWSKGTKWVNIETLLGKTEAFQLPACFVFCRTNEKIQNRAFDKREHGYPYPLMTPVEEVGKYLYFEGHGRYTGKQFENLPPFFDKKDEGQYTNFVFRAPPGRKCSTLGVAHSYLPYDYFMSCFMNGSEINTDPTNDLLKVESINIMCRDYGNVCVPRFLERSATLRGVVGEIPLAVQGRQQATAGVKRSIASPIENENTQILTPTEENEHTQVLTPTDKNPYAKRTKGGSIRKTIKKRKKRKTKTRNRRR